MYTLTLFLLAVFCLYIAAFGFVRWDAGFLLQGDTPAVRAVLVLLGVIFLFYGLYLAYDLCRHCRPAVQKRIKWGLLAVILAGQLGFLLYFHPSLRYDALKTFDQAVEMLRTHTISGTYETGYFARYTNNYPITILTYWLLSLASALGLSSEHYMLFIQLLNVGLLDLSLLLGYRILNRLRGACAALFYLLLCALCPATYVWSGFFYTSTLSMPFFLGILLLFFRMQENLREKSVCRKKLLLSARDGLLLGICVIFGYKFRATALIALIAFAIAALYQLPLRNLCSALKARWKPVGTACLTFFLACVLSFSFWSAAVSRYVAFDYENTGFPPVHWVMMGMRWDGAYDQSDELYTLGFETKEEKKAADMELLAERILEAGPGGLISLMGRKLLNTWVDGTDTWEAENSALRSGDGYGKLYEYILGNKDGLWILYGQVFRVLQMLVLGISALLMLLRRWKQRKKKSLPPGSFLLQLALLGGMSFHLIWETNPLYSLSFLFLSLLLMADQMILLLDILQTGDRIRNSQKAGRLLCSTACICLLVLLVLGQKQLVETPIEENLYRVNQYQYAGENRSYVQEYEEVYTQTFVADQPFNRIAILACNSVGEYNQSAFTVELTDENGNQLYYNDRFLSGMVVKQEWYAFSFDMIVPDGPTTYTLTLSPGYIHGEDSLQFLYYHTGNEDLYPDGSLAIAGEELENGDLVFAVYEYQVTTYFNQKVYLLLCACLLLCCGAVTWGVWRRK